MSEINFLLRNKLLVILGPTATGKTDLGLSLAKKFNGEIVACDSRQVYIGLDIGTGKLPSGRWMIDDGGLKKGKGWWEVSGVKIWMYDVVDPKDRYTVADYVRDGSRVVDEIISRDKLPILIGGTGLYIRALLEGLPNLSIPIDEKLREELSNLSKKELQDKLRQLSKERWNKLNKSDRENPRRLLRSIELVMMYPYIKTSNQMIGISDEFNVLKIGLTAPRQVLYNNINSRAACWIKKGIIEEVKKLIKKGVKDNRLEEMGLHYREVVKYIKGELDSYQLLEKIQVTVRQYAKRQLTWFKKEKDVSWFDITNKDSLHKIEKMVTEWYSKTT